MAAIDFGQEYASLVSQIPALVLFAGSIIGLVKLFLAHLKSEGEDTREVIRELSRDLKENTEATRLLVATIQGHHNTVGPLGPASHG